MSQVNLEYSKLYNNNAFGGKDGFEFDTTSYDYDAPLSENGDMRNKFYQARDLIANQTKVITDLSNLKNITVSSYPQIAPKGYISLWDMKSLVQKTSLETPVSMENLDLYEVDGTFYGQNFGYTLYETTVIEASNGISGMRDGVRDRAHLYVRDS